MDVKLALKDGTSQNLNHYQNWAQKATRLVDLTVQGDHSGCAKPPVDIKTKVPFYYMGLILNWNFCFDVNRRFGTTWMVTLCILFQNLTRGWVVVGVVQVKPQISKIRPDGGRGGVDAGNPSAGLQCRGWAPECRTARLRLAGVIEELGHNSMDIKNNLITLCGPLWEGYLHKYLISTDCWINFVLTFCQETYVWYDFQVYFCDVL